MTTKPWRDAWAMLLRGGRGGSLVVLTLFGLLFLGFAFVIAMGPEASARGLPPFVLSLPVAMFWGGYVPGLLPMQRQLSAWRVPHADGAGLRAMALAWLVSVALPAALMAAVDVDPVRTVAVLTIAAACAWGYMMLPVWAGIALILMPSLGMPLLRRLGLPDPLPAGVVPVLAVLAMLALAWRWRHLLRLEDWDELTGVHRPMYLTMRATGGWRGTFGGDADGVGSARERLAGTSRWLQDSGRLASGIGPRQPVRAVRAWLGFPFAPRSPQAWGRLIAYVGVVVAIMWLLDLVDARGDRPASMVGFIVWLGCGMWLMAHPNRLQSLVHRQGSEWNELALLPNIAARDARGALLHTQLGVGALLVTGLLSLAMRNGGLDAAPILLAGLLGLGCVLWSLAASVWAVLGLRLGIGALIVLVLIAAPLLSISALSIVRPLFDAGGQRVLAAIWVVACIGGATVLSLGWSRWRAQPHPFLQR